jgi:hypothetical protein
MALFLKRYHFAVNSAASLPNLGNWLTAFVETFPLRLVLRPFWRDIAVAWCFFYVVICAILLATADLPVHKALAAGLLVTPFVLAAAAIRLAALLGAIAARRPTVQIDSTTVTVSLRGATVASAPLSECSFEEGSSERDHFLGRYLTEKLSANHRVVLIVLPTQERIACGWTAESRTQLREVLGAR